MLGPQKIGWLTQVSLRDDRDHRRTFPETLDVMESINNFCIIHPTSLISYTFNGFGSESTWHDGFAVLNFLLYGMELSQALKGRRASPFTSDPFPRSIELRAVRFADSWRTRPFQITADNLKIMPAVETIDESFFRAMRDVFPLEGDLVELARGWLTNGL